ncbi:MAG: phosphatase PAP2 family protein [Cytophagia bacterium]|nr:MAG: phosphatase PAP2 family protein [Runella sp.]TAG18818.1 MAG: phosphatase PAP2 family protein [Cytophagales bacterium]TAG39361.1 MAG: phosphatase PAP2 family protein [Cytophagia bacterium]TAG79760.1 MAG: phosphatase PAP2 family protein [Cytophagales bacterium]
MKRQGFEILALKQQLLNGLVLVFFVSFNLQGHCQAIKADFETTAFHQAHQLLTDIIVTDILTPPVASRVYVYAHVAAYETLAAFNTSSYRSLAQQIKQLTVAPPPPNAQIIPAAAAIEALLVTGRSMIFSEPMFDLGATKIWKTFNNKGYAPAVLETSRAYGRQVAQHILAWASQDNYKATRAMRRYAPLKRPGAWLPTPPGYMGAVEPHWNRIRTLVLDSAAQYKPMPNATFSSEKTSAFYQLAQEVHNVGKNLTEEQRLIANYWDCNPFFLNTQGHLNFATKKLSPGGHWLSIVSQVAVLKKANLIKSSAAYTLSAIALFDGFISCWDEKYRSNVIRPETYINAHLDESWRPVLQTPPFPEYTSGHSVISSAVAEVLTHWFGDNIAFLDTTEVPYGLPTRKFTSFRQAAQESSISRLYGGIHYRPAIENGQKQGKKIGEWVLKKIVLTK